MGDMTEIRNIVIFTGAGVNSESGIDTFRDAGGLWEKYRARVADGNNAIGVRGNGGLAWSFLISTSTSHSLFD